MRRLFKPIRVDSSAGNLAGQSSIFPAYDGAVVRLVDGKRELTMMHWASSCTRRTRRQEFILPD